MAGKDEKKPPKKKQEEDESELTPVPKDANQQASLSATTVLDLQNLVGTIREVSGQTDKVPDEPTSEERLLDIFAEETELLRSSNAKPELMVPILMEKIGFGEGTPLGKAARITSKMAGENVQHPEYHNPQHITEVVLAAYCLGMREHLPKERLAEVLVAAASHDLGHTGGVNKVPYELETQSYQIAYPHLKEAGLSDECVERIGQMIVSTDFANGVPLVREAYQRAKGLPKDHPDRLVASQCLILVEADVLFSCFNEHYNDMLSRLLSVEWDMPQTMSFEQRIGFLSSVSFISDASRHLGLEARRKDLVTTLKTKTSQIKLPKDEEGEK